MAGSKSISTLANLFRTVSGPDVCSNHGSRVCGPCECRDPYFGDDCECSPRYQKSDELCKSDPNSNMVSSFCHCQKVWMKLIISTQFKDYTVTKLSKQMRNPYARHGFTVNITTNFFHKHMKQTRSLLPTWPVTTQYCSQQGRCECGKCVCRHPATPPGVETPYIRYGEFCECSNYECPKGGNGKVREITQLSIGRLHINLKRTYGDSFD